MLAFNIASHFMHTHTCIAFDIAVISQVVCLSCNILAEQDKLAVRVNYDKPTDLCFLISLCKAKLMQTVTPQADPFHVCVVSGLIFIQAQFK